MKKYSNNCFYIYKAFSNSLGPHGDLKGGNCDFTSQMRLRELNNLSKTAKLLRLDSKPPGMTPVQSPLHVRD